MRHNQKEESLLFQNSVLEYILELKKKKRVNIRTKASNNKNNNNNSD